MLTVYFCLIALVTDATDEIADTLLTVDFD